MDLSTSLSGSKEFRVVKRGYDPDEVNAFLDQIALGVGELKRKLAEAEDRAVAAAAAPKPAPAAPPPPPPAATAEAEEIHRALILAQRAADEEVRKATEEGEALVANARQRADEMRVEVEEEVARRRDDGRADLLTEIDELEHVRDALANDVVVLERHVDEQREVVQAAIGELQSLLDHPEAFRIAAASGVSAVVPPLDRPAPAPEPVVDEPPAPVVDEAPAPAPTPPAAPAEPGPDLAKQAPEAAPPGPPPEPVAAEPAPTPPTPAPPVEAAPTPPPPPVPPAPPAPLLSGPAGGDEDERDVGLPTEAVAAVGDSGDAEEDAFLAELRKAMLDDEPLGPRDTPAPAAGFDDDEAGRGRSRFGRRR